MKITKLTKCKMKQEGCEGEYKKWSITQRTCKNPACAIELMNREKAKRARKEHAAAKVRAKTRQDWLKDCQAVFNRYIRKRDEGQPCISCGRHHTGQYHAGHYLSVGAHPSERFNEDNNHLQCAPCNNHLSGNIVNYRKGLIAKIGVERVELLEGPHDAKKYTIPELQELIAVYKLKLRGL